MISAIPVVLSVAILAADRTGPVLVRLGGDPSRGLLVNRSVWARPFDRPEPSLPTVIFVHGFNPTPRLVRFGMAEEFASAMSRRGGPPVNVLAWDWNEATFTSLRVSENSGAAVEQGRALARSLASAGLDPARVHLVGHSAGGMVVASAARELALAGRRVGGLTFLDPAVYYHGIIFEQLGAGSLAPIVENYWSPGPSGYGRQVATPGVRDIRVEGPAKWAGVVCPLRSDHLFVVRWYLATVADPRMPSGYNVGPIATGLVR